MFIEGYVWRVEGDIDDDAFKIWALAMGLASFAKCDAS